MYAWTKSAKQGFVAQDINIAYQSVSALSKWQRYYAKTNIQIFLQLPRNSGELKTNKSTFK